MSYSSKYHICLLILFFVLGSFCIVQSLAFYVTATWDIGRIEEELSQGLNRPVHIGKIRWHIDFRGLAFDTDEISVLNKDNTPFFHSDKTTLLFGIFPLLRGKLRIKHLYMKQPQAWIERLTQNKWNFSDLPQAEIFSKFADCEVINGRLHLIDRRPNTNIKFASTEVKDINFDVRRPLGKYYWPFRLSANIEQPEGLCKIGLKGSGSGTLNDWPNCHYSFELAARNLDLMRLADFYDSIPQTDGLVDIDIKGSGIPSSEFKGTTKFKTDHFVIRARGLKPLMFSNITTQAKIECNTKEIILRSAQIELKDKNFCASALNGSMKVDQNGLHLAQIKGVLKQGEFEAAGELLPQQTNNLKIKGTAIAIEDVKALATSLHFPSILDKIKIHGNVKTIDFLVSGNQQQPRISFTVSPERVIIEAKQTDQAMTLSSGLIGYKDNNLSFGKLGGKIGDGNFLIDGQLSLAANASSNVNLSGQNVDLYATALIFQSLGLQNTILSDRLIRGKAKDFQLRLLGTPQRVNLALYMVPDDIRYQPIDSHEPIHIDGGVIKYENEVLALEKVNLKSPLTQFQASTKISHCTNRPQVENVNIENASIDLKEISDYLLNKRNPEVIWHSFKQFLDNNDISALQGKLIGNLSFDNSNKTFALHTDCALQSLQFKRAGQTVVLATGSFHTNKIGDMELEAANCSLNKSIFNIKGRLLQFHSFDNLHPNIKIEGQVYYNDISPLFSASAIDIRSNAPIAGKIFVLDRGDSIVVKVSARLDENAEATVTTSGGTYNKPIGQPISAHGIMTFQGPNLTIGTSDLTIGQLTFQTAGKITDFNGHNPNLDMKFWIHDPIPMQNVISVAELGQIGNYIGAVTGSVRGGIHIVGPVNKLTIRGGCTTFAVGLPKFNVTNVSGHIRMLPMQFSENKPLQNSIITLNLDTVKLGPLFIKGLSGNVSCFLDEPQAQVKVDDLKGNLAGGTFTSCGAVSFSPQLPFNADIQIDGLDTKELTQELGDKKTELTGKADMKLTLRGDAKSPQEFFNSLSGSGSFHAVNGWVEKLSELQRKLEEANIAESGILGFRLNNLWSTSNPLENGEFLSTKGQFKIDNGIVQLEDIVFDGEEMKLKGAGTLNLNSKRITLHATGDIPRTTGGGLMAKVTSFTSVAELTEFVAKEAHVKSITVPGLVHLSDNPRCPFAFIVDGMLDQPNTISSSIAKSFHWTANSPTLNKIKSASY